MYMAWVRTVCGRLESRLRLTPDIAYNAFPFPDLTTDTKERLTGAIETVLTARDAFPSASLADLYDPLATPQTLNDAHDSLDRAVAACYSTRRRLDTDADRLSLLFERYEQLQSPLLSAAAEKLRRTRR